MIVEVRKSTYKSTKNTATEISYNDKTLVLSVSFKWNGTKIERGRKEARYNRCRSMERAMRWTKEQRDGVENDGERM